MVQKCSHDWCYLKKRGLDQRTSEGLVQPAHAVKVAKTVEKCGKKLVSFRTFFADLKKLRKYGVILVASEINQKKMGSSQPNYSTYDNGTFTA